MLIEIDDTKTVADIQERFSLCFPHLKIEFYDTPHHWQELTANEYLINPNTYIRDIRKNHNPGILEIKSWHKTGDVEQIFKKIFGLNAQIFKLEGKQWKQSIKSDNLTLALLSKNKEFRTGENNEGR